MNYTMKLRQEYGGGELDDIFCYFMRTVLRSEKTGIQDLPIEFEGDEPVRGYLKLSMELFLDAQPTEITELILRSEYDYAVQAFRPNRQQILALQVIKNLSQHIRFDKDRFEYLLSTANMWQDKANAFACKTFYPNLPLEIQRQHGYDAILRHFPKEQLEPDNY